MTTANWKKAFTQLDKKPDIKKKYVKHNKPKERSCGIANNNCRHCGRHRGHNKKYGLHLCRQCFRQYASELGFKKYR